MPASLRKPSFKISRRYPSPSKTASLQISAPMPPMCVRIRAPGVQFGTEFRTVLARVTPDRPPLQNMPKPTNNCEAGSTLCRSINVRKWQSARRPQVTRSPQWRYRCHEIAPVSDGIGPNLVELVPCAPCTGVSLTKSSSNPVETDPKLDESGNARLISPHTLAEYGPSLAEIVRIRPKSGRIEAVI